MAFKRLAGVKWTGLDSFEHELMALTQNMVGEAQDLLRAGAEQALQDIAGAYPIKSGALRRGLRLVDKRGLTLSGVELQQTAPHGYIYEKGTKPRSTATGAFRGLMPARPTFVPLAEMRHVRSIRDIVERLYAHGAARVTGAEE